MAHLNPYFFLTPLGDLHPPNQPARAGGSAQSQCYVEVGTRGSGGMPTGQRSTPDGSAGGTATGTAGCTSAGAYPGVRLFRWGGGFCPQDNPAGELSQGVVMRFSTNGTAGGTAGGTGGMHNGRYSGKHSGRSIPRLTDLVGRHFPGKKKAQANHSPWGDAVFHITNLLQNFYGAFCALFLRTRGLGLPAPKPVNRF